MIGHDAAAIKAISLVAALVLLCGCIDTNAVKRGTAVVFEYFSFCNTIPEGDDRQLCYYEVAMKKDEPRICEEMASTGLYYTRDRCYASMGMCPKIQDKQSRYECFFEAVTVIPPCEEIADEYTRDMCIKINADSQRNSTSCKQIVNTEVRDWCYREVSESLNDKGLCQYIQSREIKYNCLAAGEYYCNIYENCELP